MPGEIPRAPLSCDQWLAFASHGNRLSPVGATGGRTVPRCSGVSATDQPNPPVWRSTGPREGLICLREWGWRPAIPCCAMVCMAVQK